MFGACMLVHAGDRSRPEWVREGQELLSLVGPGMTVVDAGAGFGYCTLLCAQAVGPTGRAVAIEPEPDNFDLLRRNLGRPGVDNVDALQLALGAQAATASLWVSGTHRGRHSLHRSNVLNGVGSRRVTVTTLDTVLDRHLPGLRVDLLKIDVEGEEMALVQGAARALAGAVSRVWFDLRGGPGHRVRAGRVLQTSKGSISTATRLLVLSGLVERRSQPGQRRDYFRIRPEAWVELVKLRLNQVTSNRQLTQRGLTLLDPCPGCGNAGKNASRPQTPRQVWTHPSQGTVPPTNARGGPQWPSRATT